MSVLFFKLFKLCRFSRKSWSKGHISSLKNLLPLQSPLLWDGKFLKLWLVLMNSPLTSYCVLEWVAVQHCQIIRDNSYSCHNKVYLCNSEPSWCFFCHQNCNTSIFIFTVKCTKTITGTLITYIYFYSPIVGFYMQLRSLTFQYSGKTVNNYLSHCNLAEDLSYKC